MIVWCSKKAFFVLFFGGGSRRVIYPLASKVEFYLRLHLCKVVSHLAQRLGGKEECIIFCYIKDELQRAIESIFHATHW